MDDINKDTCLHLWHQFFCRKYTAFRLVTIKKLTKGESLPTPDRFLWPGTAYAEVNKTV